MKTQFWTNILSRAGKAMLMLTLVACLASCDNIIYDYEDDCDPDPVLPDNPGGPDNPDTPDKPAKPGYVKIYVRTNPGSGGLSKVFASVNPENSAETEEGIYVGIELKENDLYTLTAVESNPEYKFVRWHDDTNDGDLTEGKMDINNIEAAAETRYTAIFDKIKEPAPEPEPEMKYLVKFVFERNMQFVDAFSTKVNSVDLYVFNTSGQFIKKYHEDGDPLRSESYLMDVTDLGAGTYQMIAWCGLTGNDYFSVPSSVSSYSQLAAELKTNSGTPYDYQDKALPALFHGMSPGSTFTYTTEEEEQIHTIYLTKDTNDITITLQHRQLLPFAKDRFKVTMTDNNGVMSYDNSLNNSNAVVEYRPHKVQYDEVTGELGTRAVTTGNYLKVDLATARLMENHNPTITVVDTENSNKVVFSIPLIKWAIQLRSTKYSTMPDQEYLDREDTYNLMLWLDSYDPETGENEGWFGAAIEILDWHVSDDVQELK